MNKAPNAEILVSPDLMRVMLDLPIGYSVVGSESAHGLLRLFVHAPDLTEPLPETPLHLLTPIYRRVRPGETELKELRITPAHER